MRLRTMVWCALLVLMLSGGVCFGAEQYAVVYERNVAVKMRDGVTLRADIYRPQTEGTFPVLLQRTPYMRYPGGNEKAELAILPATNTIYHDAEHPSVLILPMVPLR